MKPRWRALALALLVATAAIASSSSSTSGVLLCGVDAAAVPSLPSLPGPHQRRSRRGFASSPTTSTTSVRGGAAASVSTVSTVSAVAAASSFGSSAEIAASSSYEFVRNGGLVALWYALRKSVGCGFQCAWQDATTAKFLLSGAVAGIVSRTAVSPLEVIATAQMVQGKAVAAAAAGSSHHLGAELHHLWRTEGLGGFFKGNGANCLKVAPTRGVQFFAFEAFKQKLLERKRRRHRNAGNGSGIDASSVTLTPVERLLAGGVAGMIASSLVYPLEVIKTMRTVYPGQYPGIGAAASGVFKQAGLKGFYKGLNPTLLAMFPYVGVEFAIYESCKIAVEAMLHKRAQVNGGKAGRHDATVAVAVPVLVSLGLGALAGACAQTTAHPLDVVRKRLQVQGLHGNPILYKNTLECFVKVARTEGIAALYKGLGPACVATIPGTAIAYITYESMKRAFRLESV